MTRLIPPVWFLFAVVAMAALDRFAPGAEWSLPIALAVGAALVAGGLALAGIAAGLFRKHGTPVRPFEEVTTVVVEGPYRVTRNPMYLGMMMVVSGIGLLLESLTPLLVLPFLWWVLDHGFIAKEERFLTERFGSRYLDYKQRVRRWF